MYLETVARAVVDGHLTTLHPNHIDDLRRHLDEIQAERAAALPHLLAAQTLETDDLEIDGHPIVSPGEGGVWVSAWVWVPTPTNEGDDD